MKLLYITSLSGKRINGFMRSAIAASQRIGLDFTMACNMEIADKKEYEKDCQKLGINVVHIDFNRNPINLKNIKAYFQLKRLLRRQKYDIVHCNTPIGGVLGRICAKQAGVKRIIYMAHGFHFWNGAPIVNWLLYYPVERFLAKITDELVTINNEDYRRALHFNLSPNGRATLIHGVGVETNKVIHENNGKIRQEIGANNDTIVYVTVGELIPRKNHLCLIKAFQKANLRNSKLVICGDGKLRKQISKYIIKNGLSDKVYMLGFRNDIPEILEESDVFVFPSLQEGLPGALMEAMSCGKACLASKIRGNIDLLGGDYHFLFDLKKENELIEMLKEIPKEKRTLEKRNKERIKRFDIEKVVDEFVELYSRAIISANK